MNRLLTAATLLVSLFVTQTVAESEPCSEPIVAVYVDVDEYSSPDDKVRWRTELTETVLEAMAPTATGVQLTSELDSEFKEPGMDAGRFEYYFLIEIQPGTWPDHEGNLYNMRMTAKLVSRYEKQFLGENVVLLGQEKTLSSMLTDLVARFGSFESLIRNFELKYPAPPRDPVTEVTSDPVELSTCGEPRRAELSVTVKHCNGKPSHTIGEFSPNLVFFEKETERGHVKPKPPFERNSTFRNKSGTARAIYHFDPKKGRYAGEDSVTISYFGRGKKRYESEIFVDLIDPLPSRMDLRMAHSLVTPNEKVDVSITGIRDSAGRVPVWPQDLIVCIDEGRLSGGRPIPARAGCRHYQIQSDRLSLTYTAPDTCETENRISVYNVCDMSGDTLAKWTPDKPAASKQILVKCPAGVRLRVTYSENGVYQVDKSKCEEVRDAGCLKRILNDKGELNFQMSFESVLPYLTTMRGGKRVPRIYRGKGKDIFQQTGSHDHRYRNFSEHCSREKWYLPCEYWSTETKDIRTVATGGQVAVKTSSDLEIYQDGSWELSAGNPTRGASSPPIGYTYSCRQEQSSTRPRAGKPAHRTLWDDSGSVAVPSGWLYGAPLHWFTRIVLRKADQLEKFTKGKTKVNGHVKWQEQGNSFSGYLVSRSGPWDQLDGDQCEERDRALRYSEGFYHFANDPVRWASGAGCYWRHYEDEGPVLNKEFTYEIEYLDMKEDE